MRGRGYRRLDGETTTPSWNTRRHLRCIIVNTDIMGSMRSIRKLGIQVSKAWRTPSLWQSSRKKSGYENLRSMLAWWMSNVSPYAGTTCRLCKIILWSFSRIILAFIDTASVPARNFQEKFAIEERLWWIRVKIIDFPLVCALQAYQLRNLAPCALCSDPLVGTSKLAIRVTE